MSVQSYEVRFYSNISYHFESVTYYYLPAKLIFRNDDNAFYLFNENREGILIYKQVEVEGLPENFPQS